MAILGWFSEASSLASRSNRARRFLSFEKSSGRTLIATLRPSLLSRALYTWPIPPAPMGERIS